MRRTNIYLGDEQSGALDQLAHARGISRAELIRDFIDAGLGASGAADLDADQAAIRESFGVLGDEDLSVTRGPDERALHLERLAAR
jgi:hypothetical protein